MSCGRTDWVGFEKKVKVEESQECVWGRWSPVKRVLISEKFVNKAIKT